MDIVSKTSPPKKGNKLKLIVDIFTEISRPRSTCVAVAVHLNCGPNICKKIIIYVCSTEGKDKPGTPAEQSRAG